MSYLGQNLGIKLLSLVCSFCLFLYVHKQQATETTFFVPLTIQHNPETRVVDESTVRRVQVTLSGPADRLEGVEEQVKAVADLAGQGSGTYHAAIVVKPPADAHAQLAVDWKPRVATVQLEGRASRRLAVQVKLNVQPPPGLSLDRVRAIPDMAQVHGWESVVRRVRHLQAVVNSLSTERVGSSVDLEVPIRALDNQGAEVGEEIQVQPPTIKVRAQLLRSVWSKPVYVSPTLGEIPRSVRLQRIVVTPSRLTLRGPEAAVGPVQFLETEPIPIPETPGVVDREARVLLPPGVKTEEPPRVRVVIALQGASS